MSDFWCVRHSRRLLEDGRKNGEDVVKKFRYEILFDWHIRYRQAVDDHDNLSNSLSPIEDTRVTESVVALGICFHFSAISEG